MGAGNVLNLNLYATYMGVFTVKKFKLYTGYFFTLHQPIYFLEGKIIEYKNLKRASLVAQWLRICLPMQGTRVRSLVREDPTCHGATKPCATAIEPVLWSPRATTTEAHVPRARAPQQEKPPQ